MFYFISNILIYLILFIIIYHFYNRKRVNVLNFLIMLFLLNVYFVLLYKDINIIVGFIITLLVFSIERLYNYLYFNSKKNLLNNKILIKDGNINFKGLIDNKYSFNRLINNLQRKGVKDINKIDYCALYNNDLIIFSSNIKNYPINLIVDGKVNNNNLRSLKKDKDWLIETLSKNNLVINDVSYAFYKDDKLYFLTM